MTSNIDIKTIRGVVVLNNDRFKTLHVDGDLPRRTITYQGNSFPELYFEEIQQGDNVIFVALSDDPAEPERIVAANLVLDFNLIPIAAANTTPNSASEQNEITIEFTAMKSMDENPAVLSMLKKGKFGNAGNRELLDDLYGSPTRILDAMKDWGVNDLEPTHRNVLGTTPFDYVVAIRGNAILKVRTPVRVNGQVYPVIQPGDPIPQHRHTYLFIQHTRDNKPMGGFILPDVFLSRYIGKTEYLPGLPSNTKWVDRREVEQVVFDFRPAGEVDKWVVIAVHAGMIVYSDPVIEHQMGEFGTLLQPNAPLPAKPVNVLLLDYDVIPGTATYVYRACNVDLNKIVKDGKIEFKRPMRGLPGFIIDDVIFSEASPYDFQYYGDYTRFPRFMPPDNIVPDFAALGVDYVFRIRDGKPAPASGSMDVDGREYSVLQITDDMPSAERNCLFIVDVDDTREMIFVPQLNLATITATVRPRELNGAKEIPTSLLSGASFSLR